jgi:pimeloyl-ACP methyl ester carboxylesterase
MKHIELSAGRLYYRDAGEGRPVVFVHGVFVNSTLWRKLEAPLVESGLRLIAPDWPLGSHRVAMNTTADMTPGGVARLIGEFLDRLDLNDVILVATDTGGAITQLLMCQPQDRVAQVVLTPCDSFDNFLPRSIRALQYAVRVPGALALGVQPFRSHRLRSIGYRTLAKHPNPADITADWAQPLLTNSAVRRDVSRFLAAIDHRDTLLAAQRLRTFDKPVLIIWPRDLPFFPYEHALLWLEILPDATLVDAGDSYTFVCEDQPELLAREISAFAATGAGSTRGAAP